MTVLFNQRCPEFDDSEELEAPDRAQPLAVEPCGQFIMLTQQDGGNDCTHCVLIERRDLREFIETLLRC